jgi:glycosyltransferase involved in cell wall biosynthesis
MRREGEAASKTVVQVVLSLGRGGLETMAADLAVGLKRRGLRSVIVALDEGGGLEGTLRDAGVEYIVLNGRRFKDPRFHLTLATHLRRVGAGVVHTHSFAPLLHSLPALALTQVRRIVNTEHSFEYLEPRPDYRRALRWMSRTTRAFTVVGERMLPYYADTVRVSRARLRVIPNGIDTTRYRPSIERGRIRAELGIPANAFVAGSAGRLAPEKNYQMLLAAAAQCQRECRSVHVVFFGDGEMRSALAAQAEQLGLGEKVLFAGWRTDMHRLLGALDVFVLTSESEGLPLALLEAMASGLPVISTPVGDIPCLVKERQTGHLVPKGDASSMARLLLQLSVDPAQRRAMGESARQAITNDYSHEGMISRYLDAYGLR